MNIPVRHATAATKLAIVDCDIHPAIASRRTFTRSCRRDGAST